MGSFWFFWLSWAISAHFWTHFGLILDPFWSLWALWGHFGSFLDPFWSLLGPLGPCWSIWGPFWVPFGPLLGNFGSFRDLLGHLGPTPWLPSGPWGPSLSLRGLFCSRRRSFGGHFVTQGALAVQKSRVLCNWGGGVPYPPPRAPPPSTACGSEPNCRQRLHQGRSRSSATANRHPNLKPDVCESLPPAAPPGALAIERHSEPTPTPKARCL